MSVNPTDLLAQRHRSYRQTQERHKRATAAREGAQQRVAELESELVAAEGRDRVALGDAIVDDRRPSKPEADSVRAQLEDAKRKAEALVHAEQRAAETLSRLPIERKDEWERQALRDLRKACGAYIAAISDVARARDLSATKQPWSASFTTKAHMSKRSPARSNGPVPTAKPTRSASPSSPT